MSPILDTLRRRPELIVGPALGFWLLANCLPITFGHPFVVDLFRTATFRGSSGNVFPVTYACAVALFGYAVALLNGLNWPRRLLVSLAVPFAFTHLYEVPYDLIGYAVWYPDYNWALWPIVLFLNASWLALGLSTVPFWRLEARGAALLAIFLASFAAWWIWFVPYIPPIQPPQNPEGSGYILSKVVLAALVGCLLWYGRSRARATTSKDRPEFSASSARTELPTGDPADDSRPPGGDPSRPN